MPFFLKLHQSRINQTRIIVLRVVVVTQATIAIDSKPVVSPVLYREQYVHTKSLTLFSLLFGLRGTEAF